MKITHTFNQNEMILNITYEMVTGINVNGYNSTSSKIKYLYG